MRELNDKDFDQAFKKRINESYPEFEEESWLKMEKKLRRRDRLIWYRNASIILLFLSFGLGFYLLNFKKPIKEQPVIAKKQEPSPAGSNPSQAILQPEVPQGKTITAPAKLSKANLTKSNEPTTNLRPLTKTESDQPIINLPIQNMEQVAVIPQQEATKVIDSPPSPNNDPVQNIDRVETALATKTKVKHRIPVRLSISAGPDLNSTSSLVGGKTSVAVGIGVEVGLSRKLSVQTGLNYGDKNYNASGYDYSFSNPNVQANISSIEALCKVLEIPLKASYNLSDNSSRSIDINAGLSSYLMLKENYVFKYLPSTGRADRVNEVNNANQHFLSVLELSATYHIKLSNKKLALGFEPYVKIPLAGVGEGNIRLKSSGVSLKLRYELNKK